MGVSGSVVQGRSSAACDSDWVVVDPLDPIWDEYNFLKPPPYSHLSSSPLSFQNSWTQLVKQNVEIVEKLFECVICLEKFEDPRLLNCGHTFCSGCLVELWVRGGGGRSFSCPICRHVTILPPSAVAGLAQDVRVVQSVEAMRTLLENIVSFTEQQKAGCSVCAAENVYRDGRLYCVECAIRLCKPCTEEHNILPDFVCHTIQQVSESSFCTRHSAVCSWSCFDCLTPICVVCLLTTCKQHLRCELKVKLYENMSNMMTASYEKENDMLSHARDARAMPFAAFDIAFKKL